MIKNEKLDHWIAHGRNVLFIGKHGVGKTSKVKEAFERAGLKWKYFSAATMDPWVDFIGVPRAVEVGGKQVLELIRPKEFADDEVEAIFFDEFNRSHKKVRNAVMELLQFRSINGREFKNLKMIWAAINPDDEERYDVDRMDEAQADRFHVQIEVPYKCDRDWFISRFGKETATAAISWWDALPEEEKDKVSPRRLEYALMEASVGGDMRDILPKSCNVSKLITSLKVGPIDQVIKGLMGAGDQDEARSFLAQENNYAAAIPFILKNEDRMKFFLPVIAPEKLSSLFPKNKKVLDFVVENCGSTPAFAQVLGDVYDVTKNSTLKRRIEQLCEGIAPEQLPEKLSHLSRTNMTKGVVKPRYGKQWKQLSSGSWGTHVAALKQRDLTTTHARRHALHSMDRYLPPTLTISEAEMTLDLLNEIARQSYVNTLKRMPAFIPLANHCCQQLEQQGVPLSSMPVKYAAFINHIQKKLHAIGKSQQFYIPIG